MARHLRTTGASGVRFASFFMWLTTLPFNFDSGSSGYEFRLTQESTGATSETLAEVRAGPNSRL
jgi:hypothetical protein